jgi:hypothetical protein
MAWYQSEEGDDDSSVTLIAEGIPIGAVFDTLPEGFAGTYLGIDHTPAQLKLRETIAAWDK